MYQKTKQPTKLKYLLKKKKKAQPKQERDIKTKGPSLLQCEIIPIRNSCMP